MTLYIFQNPEICTIQRVNPNINFVVQFMHQYWFITCNKYTTLMQHIDNSGNFSGDGEEALYGTSLYFLCNFSIKLNCPLKKGALTT